MDASVPPGALVFLRHALVFQRGHWEVMLGEPSAGRSENLITRPRYDNGNYERYLRRSA